MVTADESDGLPFSQCLNLEMMVEDDAAQRIVLMDLSASYRPKSSSSVQYFVVTNVLLAVVPGAENRRVISLILLPS
jgi:hypothetical protein